MKKRVIKKVERHMLADKICELQRQIDEYDRFLGDLLIMLVKKNPDIWVIRHDFIKDNDYGNFIWIKVRELIKENADLRAKTGSGD